jgi:competence ComEA-like helix-hairpin-helix protein
MAREEVITNSITGRRPVLWTQSQRGTLLILLLIFIVCLTIKATLNRQYIPNPQPPNSPLAENLATRLDPNTATLQELIILPQLGEKRAAAILNYRDHHLATHPGTDAFKNLDDLLRITGIGPAMLETLRPHLKFPTTTPAS